jgi:hypothetical protein
MGWQALGKFSSYEFPGEAGQEEPCLRKMALV